MFETYYNRRVLSSREEQSTDEGTSDEDSDFEDITKSIENSLINNKSEDQVSFVCFQCWNPTKTKINK